MLAMKYVENTKQSKSKYEHAPYTNVYPVVLSEIQFEKKPTAFRKLHDELNSAQTTYITLIELLEAVTKGQTFKNGIHAKPSEQYHDYSLSHEEKEFLANKDLTTQEHIQATRLMKQQKIKNRLEESGKKDIPEFIETNLAVLDVDDVLGQVNPIEIMKATGAIALYYTFSHKTSSPINTEMYRYRLMFDLSESVKGKKLLEEVQQEIKNDILTIFPHLHQQTIKGSSEKSKSHGIDNITKMFYGSNQGYEVNQEYKSYNISQIIESFQKEQKYEQVLNKIDDLVTAKTTTTAEEISDIAQFLGDMNDVLSYEEWITTAIGLWNTAQVEKIDDKVIIEALQILDGNRQSNQHYLSLKQPLTSNENRATIGTLIKIAIERGYKRKYHRQQTVETEQAPQIATRTHKIEQYINKTDIYKLLENDDERILVQSDTNTGKTRASIEASKNYLKIHEKDFIYIALPTRALSQQVVEDYNLNQPVMGNNNVQMSIKKAIYNNSRLLVGTYDKAKIVYEELSGYNMIVIADEVHKEVMDYHFRARAIKNLFNLDVSKFIGLTGTPSEIDITTYDRLEIFKLKEQKVLADKLKFLNYYNANKYEEIVSQLIEIEVKENNKVLAFIDNRRVLNKVAKSLRSVGLKVATIASDNRKSKTYKHILEKQSFDKEIEVVLTTRVLADGININNTKDYVCMIAPSHYKNVNLFNINLIRQATNRFRNQYSKIIIPFYINKRLTNVNDENEPRTSEKIYNLENQYNYLLEKAQLVRALLEIEFENNIKDFTPSIAEKLAGLFRPKEAKDFNFTRAYENQRLAQQKLNHDEQLQNELEFIEAKIWEIDKRTIRQQASEDKEIHYSLFPHAFRKAIKQALNVLEVKELEADEYLLEMGASAELSEILDELTKLELETEQEKRKNVKKILHELIYSKIQSHYLEKGRVDESLEEWKILKKKMNKFHYSALSKLVRFMDYEEVIKELEYINNSTKTNELINNFNAINEIQQYEEVEGETITEKIYTDIYKNIINRTYVNKKELEEHLDSLAKDFKIKGRYTIAKRKALFSNAFKTYFTTGKSKSTTLKEDRKRVRLTSYKVIELQDVANARDQSNKYISKLYEKFNYLM